MCAWCSGCASASPTRTSCHAPTTARERRSCTPGSPTSRAISSRSCSAEGAACEDGTMDAIGGDDGARGIDRLDGPPGAEPRLADTLMERTLHEQFHVDRAARESEIVAMLALSPFVRGDEPWMAKFRVDADVSP